MTSFGEEIQKYYEEKARSEKETKKVKVYLSLPMEYQINWSEKKES